jgi:hypothetical protein
MATFRLFGDGGPLTAAEVTRRLGIEPSFSGEAGQPIGVRLTKPRDGSIWSLSSGEDAEDGVELDEQLRKLLTGLEPLTDEVWALAHDG